MGRIARSTALLVASMVVMGSGCSDYELNKTDYGDNYGAMIEVHPTSLVFEVTNVDEAMIQEFTISNTGSALLSLEGVEIDSEYDFAILSEVPEALPAGKTVAIEVAFTADGREAYGEAVVRSDDEISPVIIVELVGTSLDVPVAVCSVTPEEVEPLSMATWVGSDSFDNDYALTDYDWTLLEVPDGSAASMPGGGANRSGFTPDLAGTYVGQLVVTNEAGMSSSPCTAELTVMPNENLWIEMYWTHTGDDMDLHLLGPSGTFESSTGDCHWTNCTPYSWSRPNWGNQSSTADDPTLDLDDISGTGPENINIEQPSNGTYTIIIHDYPGSSYDPANEVTVNVYLEGVLDWTDTRSISGEDSATTFAKVTWSSGAGTVQPQ